MTVTKQFCCYFWVQERLIHVWDLFLTKQKFTGILSKSGLLPAAFNHAVLRLIMRSLQMANQATEELCCPWRNTTFMDGNPITPKWRYFIPVLETRWVKSELLCIWIMRRLKFNTTSFKKSDCLKCSSGPITENTLKPKVYLLGYLFIYWNSYPHSPN